MEIAYPSLMWLIIGVSLFVLEMAVPGFVLFFFGLLARRPDQRRRGQSQGLPSQKAKK